jgi:hypothetical protein
MRRISRIYADQTSKISFAEQLADVREVGLVIVALGAVGFFALVRRRRSRSIAFGYAVLTVGLVGFWLRYSYQPIRNLLPLLVFWCIAAAAGVVWMVDTAARLRPDLSPRTRHIAAGLAVAAVAVLSVKAGVQPFLDERLDVVDTRVEARRWLERNVSPDDDVLVAEELAILPDELRRLDATVVVRPSAASARASDVARFDYVVVGRGSGGREPWLGTLNDDDVVAQFGRRRTPAVPSYWRGNRQFVAVYRVPS